METWLRHNGLSACLRVCRFKHFTAKGVLSNSTPASQVPPFRILCEIFTGASLKYCILFVLLSAGFKLQNKVIG